MTPTVKWLTNKLVTSFRREGFVGALKSCAAEVAEIRFDLKFGIDTLRWNEYSIPQGYERDLYVSYGPTKIGTLNNILDDLREIFRELRLHYEDFIFLDLGSGKGRTLLVASQFPFRRIIGVEFSAELHSIAKKNIRAYKSATQSCTAIESTCCDATAYRMPPENTVLFLFNPFKDPIVFQLLTNLRESLQSHPRQIYILYNNPVGHHLIVESGFLEVVRVTKSYGIYKNKVLGPVRGVDAITCTDTNGDNCFRLIQNNL